MELKEKNNLWLFLWRFNQGKYGHRPNGLCSLFWGGLLGGLFFILSSIWTLPAWVIVKISGKTYFGDDYEPLGVLNTLLTILLLVIWEAGRSILEGTFGFSFTISALFGIFVVPLFLGIIILIVFTLFAIYNFFKERKNDNISIFIEGASSVWNKVCPRINWKKD